jgi:hypothetical protein
MLYIIAIDIRKAWFNKDNTSYIKLVIFSYKILLLIYLLYIIDPLINKAFFNSKRQSLIDLEGKLRRGV